MLGCGFYVSGYMQSGRHVRRTGVASWQKGGSSRSGPRLTARALSLPPLLRPADRQASGQGAARLPAERPAQGREPGAQEAESRIPGVTSTATPSAAGLAFTFPFKPKFVFIFF